MKTAKKVLVIDDEPSMHRLIEFILEDEGFQLVEPKAHDEAARSAKKGKPDVIILDIMMPEVNGFDVLKMLKEDEDTRNIPVIILSVRSMQADKDRAMSLGANNYLTKPFEPARLVKAVNEAVGSPEVA
jgi:CheY-like chemotaxis protein